VVLRCVLGLCTKKGRQVSASASEKPHCRKIPITAFRYRVIQIGSHVLAILTECVATRRVDVELADCRRGSPSAVQKVRRAKSGSARAAVVWDFAYGDASAGGRGQSCSAILGVQVLSDSSSFARWRCILNLFEYSSPLIFCTLSYCL